MQSIKKANTIEELNTLKEKFLSECNKREKRILVSEMLDNIRDFVTAKNVFESIATHLLSKRSGKDIINNYTKIIKENKSLKTLYIYAEGLKENNTPETKKSYITEALSIGNTIKDKEYANGIGNLVMVISEAFNLLGDEFVLDNVKVDKKTKIVGESLHYLSSTKKNIKNLNEYMLHIDSVSEIVSESKKNDIDVDLSLNDIVSEFKNTTVKESVSSIFDTDDKEKTFKETKQICLEMINTQKSNATDNDIVSELNKMEKKLNEKKYTFDTFTRDMLYMTELQEVLK